MTDRVWVRDALSLQRIGLLQWLCVVPALLWACYSIGQQSLRALAASEIVPNDGWRDGLIRGLSRYEPQALWDSWYFGGWYLLPLYVVVALVANLWERWFSQRRNRARHPEVQLLSLLLVLACPAGLPLWWAALGASLMMWVREFCGGAGNYRVQPVAAGFLLLGGVLALSTPAGVLPVEGGAIATLSQRAHTDGFDAMAVNFSWWDAWLGVVSARIGGAASLPLLLGGVLLLSAGLRPWRLAVGVCAGLVATALASGDAVPWYWQLTLGNTVLAAFLLATDPVCAPVTRTGQWCVGLAVGIAAALLRRYTHLDEDSLLLAVVVGNVLTLGVDRASVTRAVRQRQARIRAAAPIDPLHPDRLPTKS